MAFAAGSRDAIPPSRIGFVLKTRLRTLATASELVTFGETWNLGRGQSSKFAPNHTNYHRILRARYLTEPGT